MFRPKTMFSMRRRLSELEATRDEVLLEVHKMEKTNSTSKKEAHVCDTDLSIFC